MIFDWDEHYKSGGKSGPQEYYTDTKSWKRDILLKYCDFNNDSFIDIGCGDLEIWDNILPKNYIGVDMSSAILQQNKLLHPHSIFITANAIQLLNISSDIVVCFNMLYHILDDDDYLKILQNIKVYAKKYIIIYTWNRNIFDNGILYRLLTCIVDIKHHRKPSLKIIESDGEYQKYRKFLEIASPILIPDFKLVAQFTNNQWTYGTMYIFKKVEENK